MPAAIAGALVAGLSTGVTASFLATGVYVFNAGAFLLAAGGSLLSSGASMLLSSGSKQKKAIADSTATSTQNVRQAVTTHKVVYGQRRVSGPIVYVGSSQQNLYVHLIVVLASHRVEAIDEVWFNDECIPNDALDANGNVTSGKFKDFARIRKVIGTSSQTADSLLVGEVPEWTVNHRLRGRAYLYVRLKFSQDIYSSGIPNISAVVKGKRVYDPRDSLTKFTCNPALIARDYLSNTFEATGTIDNDSVSAAANVCDEMVDTQLQTFSASSVSTTGNTLTLDGDRLELALGDRVQVASDGTLPGGLSAATDYYVIPYQFHGVPRIKLATTLDGAIAGTAIDLTTTGSGSITVTKNAEPRFHAAGYLDTGETLGNNMAEILSAMGGKAVFAGGQWRVYAATFQTPTVTLDENDLIGPLQVQTKISRSDRFNKVKGVFASHINDWQNADYPPLTDDAAVANDGREIARDYDLPFTNRPYTAQRLSKIELKKAAQEIVVTAKFNLKALQVQAGETVMLTNARMGWVDKIFEVVEFRFALGGDSDTPQLGVELTLRETAAEIYDWASSEESDIDPAPNSSLPSAFTVSAVTGLQFDSLPLSTTDGDTYYSIVLSWSEHPDAFVQFGGQFEIQYRETGDPEYLPSFFVDGSVLKANIAQASVGTQYDIRIRAVNNIGVRSNWQTITGAIAGTGGGVGSTEDWGAFTGAVSTTEDWGDFSSGPATTEDWGAYS